MEAKMADVYVDSNEYTQNPRIMNKLERTLPVVVKPLEAGDYFIPPVLIERKAIGDFFGSWTDGHLQDQMERMKSIEGAKPAIIYEGDLNEFLRHRRKWNMASVNGILYSVAFDWGVQLLPTADEDHTVGMLQHIYKTLTSTNQYIILPLRVKRKLRTLYEKQRFIIEGLPGTGVSRAMSLLDEFGSVKGVVNAPPGAIAKLPRFPRKAAVEIEHVVNAPWRRPKAKEQGSR